MNIRVSVDLEEIKDGFQHGRINLSQTFSVKQGLTLVQAAKLLEAIGKICETIPT